MLINLIGFNTCSAVVAAGALPAPYGCGTYAERNTFKTKPRFTTEIGSHYLLVKETYR
jgi:hypothetical protein